MTSGVMDPRNLSFSPICCKMATARCASTALRGVATVRLAVAARLLLVLFR